MTASIYTAILGVCYTRIAYGLGISQVTPSKNPVYSGEPVTLTCGLVADSAIVLSVAVDCLNETQKVGALFCNPTADIPVRNIGVGVFSGYSLTGCLDFDAQNPSLGVSIIASTSWELEYRCTFAVFDSTTRTAKNITSVSSHLSVIEIPDVPKILPRPLVFNEMGSALVICESRHGKPPAVVLLTVLASDGSNVTAVGTESVSLNLSLSLRWQNATVLCNVTNHNASGITTVSLVIINYIVARYDTPLGVNTHSRSQILDCSEDISSFPSPSYKWWIPRDANVAEPSPMNTPFLTIPQGRSGFFVCIAVNTVTSKLVLVTYNVTNGTAAQPIILFISVPCAFIVGIIVAYVLRKRCHSLARFFLRFLVRSCEGSMSHGRREPQVLQSGKQEETDADGFNESTGRASERANESNAQNTYEQRDDRIETLPGGPTEYQPLTRPSANERSYAQLDRGQPVIESACNVYFES